MPDIPVLPYVKIHRYEMISYMEADVLGLINAGIAAVSGLLVASIGAFVTVSVARSASAREWIREIFGHSINFYLSMIEAINEQSLTLNAAAKELENATSGAQAKVRELSPEEARKVSYPFQRSPELLARVQAATSAFRSVLAGCVI